MKNYLISERKVAEDRRGFKNKYSFQISFRYGVLYELYLHYANKIVWIYRRSNENTIKRFLHSKRAFTYCQYEETEIFENTMMVDMFQDPKPSGLPRDLTTKINKSLVNLLEFAVLLIKNWISKML